MPHPASLILGGVLALATAAPPAVADGIAGRFDFYVLSMAWSERPCASDEDDYDEILCAAGNNGFDFLGLAPRHEVGAPTSCATLLPAELSDDVLVAVNDFMPRSLAAEEWAVRGVCSGLRARAYFDLARRAVATVVIPSDLTRPNVAARLTPSQIQADFVAANPGMTADGLAVDCRRGVFTGIKVCLTKDLAFRPCEEVHATSCQGNYLEIPEIE